MNNDQKPAVKNSRMSFSLDLRLLVIFLLVVIAVMLALWRPWQTQPGAADRTISVTGESTVKSEPDEYMFTPSYEFTNSDKSAAISSLSKKSDAIVTMLKQLGVADRQIKTNVNGYNKGIYIPVRDGGMDTYTLNITATVGSRALAQKVQDYLVTTGPSGEITPQAGFSNAKRKTLENSARDEAAKDARTKAERTAANLGFKIGKIKSIDDGSGFGIMPFRGLSELGSARAKDLDNGLNIQPGENELNFSVTVVYFIR